MTGQAIWDVTGRVSATPDPAVCQAIELAAAELLIDEGWDAVTPTRVAERAGQVPASIFAIYADRTSFMSAALSRSEAIRLAAAKRRAFALSTRKRSPITTATLVLETLFAPQLTDNVYITRIDPIIRAMHELGLRATTQESQRQLTEAVRTILDKSGYSSIPDATPVVDSANAALTAATFSDVPHVVDVATRSLGSIIEVMTVIYDEPGR